MRSVLSKFAVAVIVALICLSAVSSQEKRDEMVNTAPISWTRYRIPDQKLSFTFPKLPVVRDAGDPCDEVDGIKYQTYANQVIYEFAWYAKRALPIPGYCEYKGTFSPGTYNKRLAELRQQENVSETTSKIGSRTVNRFRFETPRYVRSQWLIWSIDQWVEMTFIYRRDMGPDEEKIVSEVGFSNTDGIDVGPGSQQVLGDAKADVNRRNNTPASSEDIVVFVKPRPGYTDSARDNNVQGKVVLTITYLANGTIGPIFVDKPLNHGLTERTIEAARKILFLPATEKGVPVDKVSKSEYSFSIY